MHTNIHNSSTKYERLSPIPYTGKWKTSEYSSDHTPVNHDNITSLSGESTTILAVLLYILLYNY